MKIQITEVSSHCTVKLEEEALGTRSECISVDVMLSPHEVKVSLTLEGGATLVSYSCLGQLSA